MTHPVEYFDAIAAGARVAIETATAPRNRRPWGSQKSQKTQESISEICEVFETPTELGIGEQLPSFPTDALPTWVAQFVRETAQSTQTPEDLAGTLTLTVVAVAVQGKYEVEVQAGYREQLSVFTQVVLPPGARKSTVFDKVARPILDYEMRLADQEAPRVAKRQTERAILEEGLKHFRAKAAREENENEQRILIGKASRRIGSHA